LYFYGENKLLYDDDVCVMVGIFNLSSKNPECGITPVKPKTINLVLPASRTKYWLPRFGYVLGWKDQRHACIGKFNIHFISQM